MGKHYLIPGNKGKNCYFNGEHKNRNGILIECRCDECNYMLCCLTDECKSCKIKKCYRKRILKFIRKQRLKRLTNFLERSFLASMYAPYPEAFIEKFID
jgi:hypothetical protein